MKLSDFDFDLPDALIAAQFDAVLELELMLGARSPWRELGRRGVPERRTGEICRTRPSAWSFCRSDERR